MADLLTKMGNQMAEDSGKSSESSVADVTSGKTLAGSEGSVPGVEVGDNLVDKTAEAKPDTKATASTETGLKDPSTWTDDSKELEIKKAREEAKQRRLQMKEQEELFNLKMQQMQEDFNTKLEQASEAQKELEALKQKDEDKKRSLDEKLAHREARIAELEAKFQHTEAEKDAKLNELNSKLKDFEVQQEAQRAVYRERVADVINNIPESKRKFAEMIAKGYADPQESLAAINEAKVQGLFDEKQVVVSHATPGADAARMTQDKLDAAKAESRKGMSGRQKINEGLKSIKSESGLRGKIL